MRTEIERLKAEIEELNKKYKYWYKMWKECNEALKDGK